VPCGLYKSSNPLWIDESVDDGGLVWSLSQASLDLMCLKDLGVEAPREAADSFCFALKPAHHRSASQYECMHVLVIVPEDCSLLGKAQVISTSDDV